MRGLGQFSTTSSLLHSIICYWSVIYTGCHQCWHAGSKTVLQLNLSIFYWGCTLSQVVLYNGHNMVILLLLLLLHLFNGLFSRTAWVSRYQKGNTSLDLSEARGDGVLGCSGISCIICKQSAPHSGQITTSAPHHSTVYRYRITLISLVMISC